MSFLQRYAPYSSGKTATRPGRDLRLSHFVGGKPGTDGPKFFRVGSGQNHPSVALKMEEKMCQPNVAIEAPRAQGGLTDPRGQQYLPCQSTIGPRIGVAGLSSLPCATKRGAAVQPDNPHPPQGALRQADGSVVWRVWAPSSAAVSLVTLPSAQRRETAMTPEGGGYFMPSASAGRGGIALCLQTGRRPRVSRSGVALAARRRTSPLRPVLSRIVRLVGRRLARHRPRRVGHLRIARRHVHAGGYAGCDRSPPAATGCRWA